MKRLEKLLRKANLKDRRLLWDAIKALLSGRIESLDIKKLGDNAYRMRKGDYRIFFRYGVDGEPAVYDIRRRNEDTYRDT